MFALEDTLPDPMTDEVGQRWLAIKALPAKDKEWRILVDEAVLLMRERGYKSFTSNCGNFFLYKVGDSYLYDVPANKTGHLKSFRGMRIRVICVGSGKQFYRDYMAGVVEPSLGSAGDKLGRRA